MLCGLKPDEFSGFITGSIYAKMVELDQQDRGVSPEALSQEVPALIRDIESLLRLEINEYGSDDFKKYIDELRKINHRINIMTKANNLHDTALDFEPYDESNDLTKYLTEFADKLVEVEESNDETENLASVFKSNAVEIIAREGLSGLSTGFQTLDKYTGGFQPGHLIIIGARPSVGKTAIAMNLINNIGKNALPLFISLEMSKKELIQRQMSDFARVDQMKYLNGNLNKFEKDRSVLSIMRGEKQNVLVNDNSYLTLEDIVKEIRWQKHRKKIGIAFIDHHDLVFSKKRFNDRRMEVTHCAITLRNLAKELDIPIVLLAQLSRPGKAYIHIRPTKYELKESSALEQSANAIILIHREIDGIEDRDRVMEVNEAEIILAKMRNGITGIFKIKHDLKYNRFYEGNYGDGS
jgi:replicative DNA helicase